MELKKNPKANLDKSRSIFFLIGMLISLASVLFAFNYATETSQIENLGRLDETYIDNDIVPVVRTEKVEEIKPPTPKPEIVELEIVENDKVIKDEVEVFDAGANEDDKIEFVQITPKEEEEEEPILIIASTPPSFPGGDAGLRKFIYSNVKYPNAARETGIEGKIYVRFCVTKTGKVEKISIIRGVDPLLDKEALRVVNLLPKWTPGENAGKKVNVWYTLPISFKLE